MLQQILLVGHCVPDNFMLKSKMSQLFPDLTVDTCNSQADLEAKSNARTLLLVNRILDGMFDTEGGIELIGKLAQSSDAPQMMLISNFAESQEQAVNVGALMGFGKSEMGSQDTEDKLRKAVERD
ncbi:MAG TPA: hypothetical protein DCM28_03825 [Phycisphaerales bacterium]|nr:hypothetical protein [Phycisphaerales bacterium]HCD33838.1 hypothetical protein [Phycisphaerales bacterium]|tara:strand:- start:112 stop:486 length:375 start_codon:yes stop_codon:yes gene_type:complete